MLLISKRTHVSQLFAVCLPNGNTPDIYRNRGLRHWHLLQSLNRPLNFLHLSGQFP